MSSTRSSCAAVGTIADRKSSTLMRLLGPVLAFLSIGALMLLGGRSNSAHAAPPRSQNKSLIYCGWYGGTTPTPSLIQQNFAFLETQPFNGLAVYMRNPSFSINATTGVMTANPMSYDTISSVLAPIADLPFQQLRDNFAVVMGSAPPDFFDNWSTTIQNFANLAAAVRDAGLRGVIFDNEQYFSNWGDYPAGVSYPGTSLAEYQAQARLRGKQVMEAMDSEFPGIPVITLHGPYVSEPDAPSTLLFPQWQSGNELLGPFFAGMQEGISTPGQNVDGGELYDLRAASQFEQSYDWRRHDMASSQIDCAFISPEGRSSWPTTVSIGFGVYDSPFAGAWMDPTVLTPTLTNALTHADKWVWFYSEQATYLLPASQGGASSAWVDAVRAALPATETESPTPGLDGGGSLGLSGGGGGGGSSRCGLLGMEIVPIFLGLAWLRARRNRSN